jgi:hypothetical protein
MYVFKIRASLTAPLCRQNDDYSSSIVMFVSLRENAQRQKTAWLRMEESCPADCCDELYVDEHERNIFFYRKG